MPRLPPFTASKSIVGGDIASEENDISGSGEAAIAVLESTDTGNQIKRNTGAGNGIFIDLGGDGLGNEQAGPHEGIQAPTIGKATATEASGSGAEPGATIRVFQKSSEENGEVASFLGEAAADGGGAWSVSYAAIPGEASVGVTQSDGTMGTSEMAVATTPADPGDAAPDRRGGGTTGGDKGKHKGKKGKGKEKGKGKKDKTPPQTTITKGPKRDPQKNGQIQIRLQRGGLDLQVQARPQAVQELPVAEEIQEAEARQARLQGAGEGRGRKHRPDAGQAGVPHHPLSRRALPAFGENRADADRGGHRLDR